jgi:hypothetical protein
VSVVKWIRKKPRLATLVDQPGGVTVGAALTKAAALMEPLRAACLAELERHILSLEEAVGATAEENRLVALEDVYRRATNILDAAGPFDLEDLCAAAYSLCELADRCRETATVDWRAVAVHVRALRLLRQLPAEAKAERAEVLDGLHKVLARVTPAPLAAVPA